MKPVLVGTKETMMFFLRRDMCISSLILLTTKEGESTMAIDPPDNGVSMQQLLYQLLLFQLMENRREVVVFM